MKRIKMTRYFFALTLLSLSFEYGFAQFPKKGLNVIIFTADDLGADGVGIGAFGGKMKDITPNIDRIAAASVKIHNAHVNSAICMPSRGILATGRYPFNSLQHGFFLSPDTVPTLMENFADMGYKIGILGKVPHSSVKSTTAWDFKLDYEDLGSGRSPSRYYNGTRDFIQKCKGSSNPYYLMVNSHDPHRPYHNPAGKLLPGEEAPSRLYKPEEVFVPGYLPDLPAVRKELSTYYNSVKRLDDTFGQVMKAIKEAGDENNTVIIFMSDNGIAMPFAKANCYLSSTRTPLFVYLPNTLKPLSDDTHMVSTVDLFPTIMAMIGGVNPKNLDGSSILPILQGKKQKDKNQVFTEIDFLNSGAYKPMRCVQDKKFGYIFNPWSDGKSIYKNGNEGETFKAMEMGETTTAVKERVKVFRYRATEELYNLEKDPDCLNNLADSKAYTYIKQQYQNALKHWMKEKGDPLLAALEQISDPVQMKQITDELYKTRLKIGEVRVP